MMKKETKKYNYTTKTGAPRKTSFEPPEMIALGEEMVAWVETNKETILHLSEWYTIEKHFTYNEWKVFMKCKEFYPYYERALRIVGKRYLDKNSNVRDNISGRWQRIYFGDLREGEDEDLRYKANVEAEVKKQLIEFDYKMKHEVLDNVSEEVRAQYNALMAQLTAIQHKKPSS
jgi:hypothetical protein